MKLVGMPTHGLVLLFLELLWEACGDANTWIGAVWTKMRLCLEGFCPCGRMVEKK